MPPTEYLTDKRNIFLTVVESGKYKVKKTLCLVMVCLQAQDAFLVASSHDRGTKSSQASFIGTLISSMRVQSLWSSQLPKGPTFKAFSLELGFQQMNLGKMEHLYCITL